MAGKNTVRQLEERHVASKVELMVWCNKIDLLAVSNVRGEVSLHRLTWQKVWTLPPPKEGDTVKGIAWRPDGKVIAIAYNTEMILLVDVENKQTVHIYYLEAEPCCVSWIQERDDDHKTKPGHKNKPKIPVPKYVREDNTATFLPKLPPTSRNFVTDAKNLLENLEDSKKIQDQTRINILVVGLVTGRLSLTVFGLFPCGVLEMREQVGSEFKSIVRADISDDLCSLRVIVLCEKKKNDITSEELRLVVFDTPVLASHACELYALALKHGYIVCLLSYLLQSMSAVDEAWENILLAMDAKLAGYAAKVAVGSVSADFLDLLMFGVPSDELQTFLLKDLTEKGLKNLGHTFELSYTNIQKLVLKHLYAVGNCLAYHFAELNGMAQWEDRYKLLGLSQENVHTSLGATGSLLMKVTEVLQVIDNSMKNYKAFFRWLYVMILRLSEERVPPEIAKISQEDLTYLSEFLLHFDGLVPERNAIHIFSVPSKPPNTQKVHFNLEMLGQYVRTRHLTVHYNIEDNPWQKLLTNNHELGKNSSFVPYYNYLSLLDQHHYMHLTNQKVFKELNISMGNLFTQSTTINNVNIPKSGDGKFTYVNHEIEKKLLFAFLDSNTTTPGFYFLEIPFQNTVARKCANVFFDSLAKKYDYDGDRPEAGSSTLMKVIDVQFYLPTSLSVLILEQEGENRSTTFVQIPTHILMAKSMPVELSCAPRVEACALLESYAFKPVDNMVASKFSVSGSRKVAVILSESRRKVRLFEMEADEEEEEEEIQDSTANTTANLGAKATKNTSLSTSMNSSSSSTLNPPEFKDVGACSSDTSSAMDLSNA